MHYYLLHSVFGFPCFVLPSAWFTYRCCVGMFCCRVCMYCCLYDCRDGTLITMFSTAENDAIARRLISKLEVRACEERGAREGGGN